MDPLSAGEPVVPVTSRGNVDEPSIPPAGDGDQSPVVARASVRRNVAQMASSQMVTWLLATIAVVVIPRFISPEQYGKWELAITIWGLVAVFVTLGSSTFLQREIAMDQPRGLALVQPFLLVRSSAFIAVSAVLGVVAVVHGTNRFFVLVVVLAGVGAVLRMWTDLYSSAFIGLERMGTPARTNVLSRLVNVVLTVAVLVAGGGLIGVLAASIASSLYGLLMVLRPYRRLNVPASTVGWREAVQAVAASASFMVLSLAMTLYDKVDVIVIAWVAGHRDLGWYSGSEVLVGSLFFPTTVVMTSMFPTFGRVYSEDRSAFHDLVRRTFSLLFVVCVPVGLGGMAVAPAFTTMLYGEDFSGSGQVLAVMSVVTVLTFGATLFAYVAAVMGRELYVAGVIFAMSALTVPLDLVLVPWTERRYDNGAIGGGLSFVVTESVQFVTLLVWFAPFVVTRAVVWKSARVLAAGAVMTVAVWPVRDRFVLLPAALGAVVYVLAVFVLRALSDSERRLIRDALGRVLPARPRRPRPA